MNRLKITADAQNWYGETALSDDEADPMLWHDLVTDSANDIARDTHCFWLKYVADIADGSLLVPQSAEYCLPRIREIKVATILDSTGQVQNIHPSTPMEMDARNGGLWRRSPVLGVPYYYLTKGQGKTSLYPIPNYTQAAGLTFEGLGEPGDIWGDDLSECPLHEDAHRCVVYGAAIARNDQKGAWTPMKAKQMQDRYEQAKWAVMASVISLTDKTAGLSSCTVYGTYSIGGLY